MHYHNLFLAVAITERVNPFPTMHYHNLFLPVPSSYGVKNKSAQNNMPDSGTNLFSKRGGPRRVRRGGEFFENV